MRIGIDGRELLSQRTGVGRYLAALCTQWLELSHEHHDFVVYSPHTGNDIAVLGPPFVHIRPRSFLHQPVVGTPGTWWEQVQLPLRANNDALDVFFAPGYSAPLRLEMPCVMTMHDVSFTAHPEWFRWREGLRRRWLATQSMVRATAVLTVSDFSRHEIIRWFDLPQNCVHVVRHGIDSSSMSTDRSSSQDPLVLYVGSLFNRRHLPTLIRAFGKVLTAVPDAKLAIVGADRTYPKQDLASIAKQSDVGDRMTLHAYIHENELVKMYRRAHVFVFLSEYEGFGLPPLEALAAGVPIVLADTPVTRELFDGAALLVPCLNVAATADAIVSLLRDDDLRRRQHASAASLLPSFDWKRAAQDTLMVLEEAARAGR